MPLPGPRVPGSLARRPLGALLAAVLSGTFALTTLVFAGPAHAAWDDISKTCRVQDTRISENSGMSRSTYRRPTIFIHNDSGGGPQFFAVNPRSCRTKAVFDVPGAPAKDWEDMASGPGNTLWFGDIGGNKGRSEINVVRVREPKKLKSRALKHVAFRLAYPDGEHNAEAMMIRPRTGRIFIITKAPSGAGIYRAPKQLKRKGVNRLTRIADAGQGLSGADFARSGKLFVLRSYRFALVYSKLGGEPIKVRLPPKAEHPMGESVTFNRAGELIFGAEGVNAWLWRVR